MSEGLATPEAVLILPDGRHVMPDGSTIDPKKSTIQQIENGKTAIALVTKMKRNLGDLPDIPDKMNPICVVLTYSSIGLSNEDIATALKCDVLQIEKLKESDLYEQLEKMFDERVFEDEQRTARHIISKAAGNAAAKMVSLVHAESGDLALAAARDVMRISGVDRSQQNGGLTSLKILLVDDNDNKKSEITVTIGQ